MLDVTRAYGLTLLFPERDTMVGASLRDYGEFARPEYEFIDAHLARHDEPGCYIDVGANLGAIALPLAARRPTWKVIAVEAHRGLSGVLAANALNNQLYNVQVLNAAAGAAPGLARFPASPLTERGNFGMLGMHMSNAATEAVRMCTLDEIAPPDTRFVKIDVEGFESEVLKGAPNLIAAQSAGWLLEAHRSNPGPALATMGVFREAGYKLFWFFAPFHTPQSGKREAPAANGISGDLNFVALPPQWPNLWELSPVAEGAWPDSINHFAYLTRYGFRPA